MKRIALMCLFLTASVVVSAQAPFNFGIKAGYNSSKLKTDDFASNFSEDNIKNFIGGVFARVNVKSFYLQPEAYYTTKGGKLEELDSKTSIDLKAIDVPILLGYKIIDKGLLNLRVNTGPVMSFVTSKDIDVAGESVFESGKLDDSIFGWQYGLGLDLLFFTFDFRMENSFGDIYSGHGDVKTKTFQFTMGFFLR